MNTKIILIIIMFAISLASCTNKGMHDEHDEHSDHEDEKVQLTAYGDEFELFAEADAFVVGKTSNVLSHFSWLKNFKALEEGSITIKLIVNGKETIQTLEQPTRKGIFSFDITPESAGNGQLKFEINISNTIYQISIADITVFETEHAADEASEENVVSKTNTTVFTKEQSWKIDYASELPKNEPFGQIIKTTAKIQSSQGEEMIISAKTNGIVVISNDNISEGKDVADGQVLFKIAGGELADNNLTVTYTEAKNNFEKSKADYERVKELSENKIVSEKELLIAKNQFDNYKAIFDNLNKNFNSSGQSVTSPMIGFIKQIFVQNGTYVESGQAIAIVSQNKTLLLNAEVQQKYATTLGSIVTATIRTTYDNKVYSLEELNGSIVSFGKATNTDNYLIPVKLKIDNKGSFISGGFVEVNLKLQSNNMALTIPNSSLIEDQGSYFVYVQINPELFEKREVKIGVSDGLKTEILSGISKNERIVTNGAIHIKLAQATGGLDAHSGHVH